MFNIEEYNVQISVQLENGVYIFDNQSAIGKTRLANKLREYQAYGEPVAVYTYNDKLLGASLSKILEQDKYKVIMIDRYDMFNGDCADLINKRADDSVIMIDCKGSFTVTDSEDVCYINMTPDRIEVTL